MKICVGNHSCLLSRAVSLEHYLRANITLNETCGLIHQDWSSHVHNYALGVHSVISKSRQSYFPSPVYGTAAICGGICVSICKWVFQVSACAHLFQHSHDCIHPQAHKWPNESQLSPPPLHLLSICSTEFVMFPPICCMSTFHITPDSLLRPWNVHAVRWHGALGHQGGHHVF